jgi:hypothetical protein
MTTREAVARQLTKCQKFLRLLVDARLIIGQWAKDAVHVGTGKSVIIRAAPALVGRSLLAATALAAGQGCIRHERFTPPPISSPRVLVIAPVLNLSGSQDFDPLKITDLVASEFQSFPNVAVIPVNLTLAELERRGKTAVESPEDAIDLARVLGADATIVTGVTEYDPYTPPVIGWVMQWYSASGRSGDAGGHAGSNLSDVSPAPRYQVQRVFNAADNQVLEQVRAYAEAREGHDSPYGWRKYIRSQELYVRYSCSATIRSILALDLDSRATVRSSEAKS